MFIIVKSNDGVLVCYNCECFIRRQYYYHNCCSKSYCVKVGQVFCQDCYVNMKKLYKKDSTKFICYDELTFEYKKHICQSDKENIWSLKKQKSKWNDYS